jgi:hypothetical protein
MKLPLSAALVCLLAPLAVAQVDRAELVRWIRDAGRVPVERDTLYNVVWADDGAREAIVGGAAPLGV